MSRAEAEQERSAREHRIEGAQLAAISDAMVALHRRYYGRGATKAKTFQVHDDLLLVELRDVYLTVERTLIERGQAHAVRATRMTFQQAMYREFSEAVEEIAGRKVDAYITETVIHPPAVVELFYLEPAAAEAERTERERREDAGEVERPCGGVDV